MGRLQHYSKRVKWKKSNRFISFTSPQIDRHKFLSAVTLVFFYSGAKQNDKKKKINKTKTSPHPRWFHIFQTADYSNNTLHYENGFLQWQRSCMSKIKSLIISRWNYCDSISNLCCSAYIPNIILQTKTWQEARKRERKIFYLLQ